MFMACMSKLDCCAGLYLIRLDESVSHRAHCYRGRCSITCFLIGIVFKNAVTVLVVMLNFSKGIHTSRC